MNVVRHMFYGSFGTQNSMVTFIFKFDLRKSHFHVKLDQISNFKNFLQKHTYLVLQGSSLLQNFQISLEAKFSHDLIYLMTTDTNFSLIFEFENCPKASKHFVLGH